MSEVKAIYDSGAAPAPAATCPTLREVLEFYADPANYDFNAEGEIGPNVILDGGSKARMALEDTPADQLTALEREALEAAMDIESRFGDWADDEVVNIGQIRALLNCCQQRRWRKAEQP